MRDLTQIIDQLAAIEPSLGPLLASTRTSACFAAPENAYLFWAEAQEVLQDHIDPSHAKYAELLAVWRGEAPPRGDKHTFIYIFPNGTIKTTRRGPNLDGSFQPRLGPAHGAQVVLRVTPEGRCVVHKDTRHNGYQAGHTCDEIPPVRLGED